MGADGPMSPDGRPSNKQQPRRGRSQFKVALIQGHRLDGLPESPCRSFHNVIYWTCGHVAWMWRRGVFHFSPCGDTVPWASSLLGLWRLGFFFHFTHMATLLHGYPCYLGVAPWVFLIFTLTATQPHGILDMAAPFCSIRLGLGRCREHSAVRQLQSLFHCPVLSPIRCKPMDTLMRSIRAFSSCISNDDQPH